MLARSAWLSSDSASRSARTSLLVSGLTPILQLQDRLAVGAGRSQVHTYPDVAHHQLGQVGLDGLDSGRRLHPDPAAQYRVGQAAGQGNGQGVDAKP